MSSPPILCHTACLLALSALEISGDATFFLPNNGGVATFFLPLPAHLTNFIGTSFYNQALILESIGGSSTLAVSAKATATIGMR